MPTQLIRSLQQIRPIHRGGVVTIGNFDGVHLGHQRLLAEVVRMAKTKSVPSILVTFEPHPFEFFAQEKLDIPRITRLREKFKAVEACGIDFMLIIPFNQLIARMSASDFACKVIGEMLQPVHLFVGDDFRFGHKRQGDFQLLQQVGGEAGFTVASLESVMSDGERISSTAIRQALVRGDLERAGTLLGRPYTMSGRVRPGDQLGRELGFRTANIFLHRRLSPVMGIFTVLVHGLSEQPLPGAANVGTRPTVDGTRTLLEVHLLDFNQDIYGRYVTVQFCKKLRDEEYYSSLELLKEQIARDVEETRIYFDAEKP